MALNTQKPALDPAYLEKLQDYYAEHKVIPSYSVLADALGHLGQVLGLGDA